MSKKVNIIVPITGAHFLIKYHGEVYRSLPHLSKEEIGDIKEMIRVGLTEGDFTRKQQIELESLQRNITKWEIDKINAQKVSIKDRLGLSDWKEMTEAEMVYETLWGMLYKIDQYANADVQEIFKDLIDDVLDTYTYTDEEHRALRAAHSSRVIYYTNDDLEDDADDADDDDC